MQSQHLVTCCNPPKARHRALPFDDWLHCVTVALVVLPSGVQRPGAAGGRRDALIHCDARFDVYRDMAGDSDVAHAAPTPFTMPLHWFTDVTSCDER